MHSRKTEVKCYKGMKNRQKERARGQKKEMESMLGKKIEVKTNVERPTKYFVD